MHWGDKLTSVTVISLLLAELLQPVCAVTEGRRGRSDVRNHAGCLIDTRFQGSDVHSSVHCRLVAISFQKQMEFLEQLQAAIISCPGAT